MQTFESSTPFLYPDPSTGYKDKNGQPITKWFIRYNIKFNEQPEGRDQVQYRKEYGKSYKINLNSIKDLKKKIYEANILLQWVKDDLSAGIDPENREIELELATRKAIKASEQFKYFNVFNKWFESKNYLNPIPSKAISAEKYSGFHLKQFIPYLESINKDNDIREVTDEDINNYILHNYDNGNWSAFTCNTRIGWLSGLFSYAYKNKLIDVNPMKFVNKITEDKVIMVDNRLILKKKKETRFNIFTQDELDLVFKELYGSPYEAIAKTIYYGFIRFSEIFRLKLGHLNLDENYFDIPASIAKGQRNGSTLKVKIYPQLKEALTRYVETYFKEDLNPDYYLFFHKEKNTPSTYSILQHHFNKVKKSIEAQGVIIKKTPYAFKHTGAKKFIDSNKMKDVKSYQIIEAIMKQMRHTDFSTTQKYIYSELGINLDEDDVFTFD